MKRAFGIARSRAGRVGLVAGVAVATVAGLALPAGANTGHVSASQSCSDGWRVTVTLDNNVTSDHDVVVTSTIPNTQGLTGNFDTTHNSGTQQIWSANGPAVASGTVTLTIWNPGHKTIDSSAQASLPSVHECHPTTTTTWATTTTICPTSTTYPETTTTYVTTTTAAPTTTAPTTTEAPTTTAAPTTTQAPTTTAAPTTVYYPPTSTTQVAGTTVVVTTTPPTHKTTTTVKEQGSTVPTTAAPTTSSTLPAPTTLPFTGSNTGGPLLFGVSCVAAGALLLMRKRGSLTRS